MDTLEERLGRALQPTDRKSVPTLNDLSAAQLGEARSLARESRVLAVRYLGFYVERSAEAADFVQEVLLDGADAASWGARDLLCYCDLRSSELATVDLERWTEAVRPAGGETWWRRRPAGPWGASPATGAPAALVRSARYWWHSPRGLSSARVSSGDIERVADGDLVVALRRWLASRMAWLAQEYLKQATPTVEGLRAALHVSSEPSADGRIAMQALLRERDLPPLNVALAPGFRGPDEWYRA